MSMTYRHSIQSGDHHFYPGVLGEPRWDEETHTLTLDFEDGETRTFGPNADDGKTAYGRLLYRDDSLDDDGNPVMAESEPDMIIYNCTFWPIEQ